MSTKVIESLLSNECTHCIQSRVKNADQIDVAWRDDKNGGYWPKPYQASGLRPHAVKAIVIGQDPTIENPRSVEYALEANVEGSSLGRFVREVFGMLPGTRFDEIYFTNLVKCRFREKPGRDKRNISEFITDIASECYSKFLSHEIRECTNAKYLFTLGRDTFAVLSRIIGVAHPSQDRFKLFYGTKFDIPVGSIGRTCYLVPLPHQPTYDLAVRYSPYGREEVRKKLQAL